MKFPKINCSTLAILLLVILLGSLLLGINNREGFDLDNNDNNDSNVLKTLQTIQTTAKDLIKQQLINANKNGELDQEVKGEKITKNFTILDNITKSIKLFGNNDDENKLF